MQEKTKKTSGADEKTPSVAQYFSWINHSFEGSDENTTMINLEYFKWLHDKYGMNLKLYLLDAGNLDGSANTYEDPETSEKLKKQYPNGYKAINDKANSFGCRLGMWAGADGFGDTEESEKRRYELMLSFCKDLKFKLFKFDACASSLRAEKRDIFKKMVDDCRKYVPDLIVLNHRNDLGDAEICTTTFLWNGMETYVDIHLGNDITASHHRMCTIDRGLVPEMKRLTEDHGVCISSCNGYFEDDLITQAFSRSLILAPEIYGNPWLLRDSEQAKLAKIYNLHEKYDKILVNGIALPDEWGKSSASRGDKYTRLIVLDNTKWEKMTANVKLDKSIGLSGRGKRFVVKTLHPYESYVGTYKYGDTVPLTVEPFRAALILVQEEELFNKTDFVLTNAKYETVYGENMVPDKALIYEANGEIGSIGSKNDSFASVIGDSTLKAPIFLGKATDCQLPENAVKLYETSMYKVNNDCLEKQALNRAGKTSVPQVKAARDAFFKQELHRTRGDDTSAMFDGNRDTFCDALSHVYGSRIDGGCLRVDFGKNVYVSKVEIECLAIDTPIYEAKEQQYPEAGTYSTDLANWKNAPMADKFAVENVKMPIVMDFVHNTRYFDGKRMRVTYKIGGFMRYFALPCPMDRICSVKIYDINNNVIKTTNAHANNLMSPNREFKFAKKAKIFVPENAVNGSYIAAAIEGVHGFENVYCAAECDGKQIGFDERAVSYPVNPWECPVIHKDRGYTYFLYVTDEIRGKNVDIYALYRNECETEINVYLCDSTDKKPIDEIKL